MKSVWVIVIHYNGEKWIRPCLQSLTNSIYPINVIVIDNKSTNQEGVDIIKKEFNQFTFVQTDKNIGFGRANNIGIQKAIEQNADYVFCLNQDAWIEPDTIGKLVDIAIANPDFGIISPLHLNEQKTEFENGFYKYLIQNEEIVSNIYFQKIKHIYNVEFVNAAAWFISSECLRKVGLFDEIFFMYGEDLNYTYRVHYHGFKIGITPFAVISHVREKPTLNKNSKNIWKNNEKYKIQGLLLAILTNINQSFYTQIKSFFTHVLKIAFSYNKKLIVFVYGMSVLLKLKYVRKSRKHNREIKSWF